MLFHCEKYKELTFFVGSKPYRFSNGQFITEDAEAIEAAKRIKDVTYEEEEVEEEETAVPVEEKAVKPKAPRKPRAAAK